MLEVKDLSFKYDNDLIFENVNFKLTPGHIYGLIGANGSGKTTMLKCLSTDYYPTSGTVNYNNIDIRINQDYLSNVMLLGSDYYIGLMSIEMLAKSLSKKYNVKIDDYIFNTLLDKLLLNSKDILKNLSKGNKKVAILCAVLSLKPKVIYLDEFLDGIDIVKRKYIKDFLLEYIYDYQAIILIASHTIDDIKDLCDQLILLNNHTIQVQEDLDVFKTRYVTYQIVSDVELDKDYFLSKGIVTKEIRSFNSIYWISIKNDIDAETILSKEGFKDFRKIESSIEEVIYYEFIS